MPDEWQCEFANAVKPVGMMYPFYVEVLCDIYKLSQGILLGLEIIEYNPVIYSFYEGLFTVFEII